MAGLVATGSLAGTMAKVELRPGVTLEGPFGIALKEGAGVDSQVGTIIGPEFECTYDIGFAANSLKKIKGASVAETTIDGRVARIIQRGDDTDGLHVVEIRKSVLGNVNMTLMCTSRSEAAREDVRKMFQTLRVTK